MNEVQVIGQGDDMEVSVVVPVKNNAELLSKLLESLLNQTLKPHEIIVVDDGSTDGSPQVAKRYGVKVLFTGGGKGPNFARSLGVKSANGDVIAFTDSDCLPSEDWIESLVKDFQSMSNVDIVAGTTIAANPDEFLARFLDNSFLTPTPKYKKYMTLRRDFKLGVVVATCNMAVSKRVFEEIGLFDPDYKYYGSDDMDFVYRALKKGFTVLCSPRPIVKHYHRASLSKILKRYFQYGQGFALFLKKHPRSTFSISVTLTIMSLAMLLLFSMLTVLTNIALSIIILLLTLSPLLVYHSIKVLKRRKIEVIIYPLLDFALVLASSAGFLFMLFKELVMNVFVHYQ